MAMKKVLVTGAGGYIGKELIHSLAGADEITIVAVDVRAVPDDERIGGVVYETADIRAPACRELIVREKPDTVVHLASIVSAGGDPEFEYSVDVEGTKNILDACVAAGVKQIVVTSSGAAYGYHADNPAWISEDDSLRGNEDFAYSRHKRLVEEMLADYRERHPALKQLIFRPGSVIGPAVSNQITNLFEKPFVLGIAGSDCAFVFIWDRDVVACIRKGVLEEKAGIYNLAGDGALAMREIARILGKPYLPLPARLIGGALGLARALGLGKLGPEHVKFLQYRPVLSNARLKNEFGLVPEKTTREAFEVYRAARFGDGA
jgi:UDP-glucose 4-epimerase